ncbi:MAG: hypothetical protein ACFCVK_23760 [Acidimicrobiales bacterium]
MTADRRTRRVRAGIVAFAVAILPLAAACGDDPEVGVVEADPDAAADHHFVIPAGSGDAIDRGEALEILPPELSLEVGEVLEIVNDDDRGHLVGPFFVGAGETLRQRFASPGEYQGICTVHPSGEFTLTVT